MYADIELSDDYLAALETDAKEQGSRELVLDDADIAPVFGFAYAHPRVNPMEDLGNGRVRFSILCDDGQEHDLRTLITKLNKKLGKWGQVIDIVAEEVVLKERWLNRWLAPLQALTGLNIEEAKKFEAKGYKKQTIRQVRMVVESPAVAGKTAKLIGAFELAEDGESVYRHALNGATEADIAPFLTRWRDCDHCGYKRNRRASFVCETTEGDRVVIGRQCSRDYLGLEAAELLAREAIRKILTIGGEEDEDAPRGGGFGRYFHTETFVQQAYLVARKLGGYSKDIRDTFEEHLRAINGAKDYGRDRTYTNLRAEYDEWMRKTPPTALDFHAFADYVMTASGPFGENLRIALGCEWAKDKRKGLIQAGVGLYVGRALKQERTPVDTSKPAAKHLPGKEAQRLTFYGAVVRCTPIESHYGPKAVVAIVGDEGEHCVHFCSGADKPEAGTRYQITATIKRQGTNRVTGGPETEITRAVYKAIPADVLL